MKDFDPARQLKEFKPEKKFFVGIDSDGCDSDAYLHQMPPWQR